MGAVASGIKVFHFQRVVVTGTLLAMSMGCAAFRTQATVTSDERVSVVLQEVVDWSFEASHPATIGAPVLARVLQGVRVGAEAKVAAYSRQDVDYLAPLLAGALAKAKREQLVVFRLKGRGADRTGAGGGTLYVKGPAIYMTPLPVHDTNAASFAAEVGFEPQDVAKQAKATTEAGLGESQLVSLIVDHWSLGKISTSVLTTASVPAPPPADTSVSALDNAQKVPGGMPEKNSVTVFPVPTPGMSPSPTSTERRPDTAAKTIGANRKPVIGSKSVVPAKPTAVAPKASIRDKSVVHPTNKSQAAASPTQEHKALLELLKSGPEQAAPPADK